MNTIIELYNRVSAKVQDINGRIELAEQRALEYAKGKDTDVLGRIGKLEEQLTQVEGYLTTIKTYQDIALKNLTSMNVATIETPPGYRVNINRLRNWLMMIDTTAANDPYAQRVYVTAKCDEHFLLEKKREFTEKLDELQRGQNIGADEIRNEISSLQEELKAYISGEEVKELAQRIKDTKSRDWFNKAPFNFETPKAELNSVSFGDFYAHIDLNDGLGKVLKEIMGDAFDEATKELMIPVEITDGTYTMLVNCSGARKNELDKAVENLFLESIHNNPIGSRRFYVLDGMRLNAKSISSISEFEGSYMLNRMARKPEEITALLEQIVSEFKKTDEILGNFSSIKEYNTDNDENRVLAGSTLVVYGWPSSYSEQDKELIQQIINGRDRYGFSVILASITEELHEENMYAFAAESASEDALYVDMTADRCAINLGDGKWTKFLWYDFNGIVSFDYAKTIKELCEKAVANDVAEPAEVTEVTETEEPEVYEPGEDK